MRVFILHDEEGNVLSVAQVEEMYEEIEQPFQIASPKHGVIELDRDDDNFKALAADKSSGKKKGLLKIHAETEVDKKSKKLLKKERGSIPAPTRPVSDDVPTRPTPDDKPPTPRPHIPKPDFPKEEEPEKPPADPKRPGIPKPTDPGKTPPTRDPTDPKRPAEDK